MRRYGIFVFYNEHGKVEPYVEVLLRSMRTILQELVILINGEIDSHEKEKLLSYSHRVFQRDNIGYDGGAYKDAFTVFLKEEDWTQWDELLLFNDTFYGPFYDWNTVFEVMDGRKCDFWGLSRHRGGKEKFFGGEVISSHIQSYFILIKKRMFTHPSFIHFWEMLGYPTSYKEAIKKFEIHFSTFFLERGFSFEAWTTAKEEYMKGQKYPGMGNMESLIKDWRFPILKKKACMLQDYISLKRLFQYLADDVGYPVEFIREDLRQRCTDGKMEPYNPKQVLQFSDQYENLYLFGRGRYAQNIEQFLQDYGKQVRGYIVSKVEDEQEQVYELEKFTIASNEGVIVALNYSNFRDVSEKIRNRIPDKQLLEPVYDY